MGRYFNRRKAFRGVYTTVNSFGYDGVDDNVNCGADSSIQLTGSQTWSVWFNSSDLATVVIMGKIPTNYRAMAIRIDSSRVYATVYPTVGSSTNSAAIHHTQVLTANTWYHVAFTIDIDANLMRVSLSGVEETNTYAFAVGTSSDDLLLGSNPAGGGLLDGSITQPMIFNRALSLAETDVLYNQDRPRTFSQLPTTITDDAALAIEMTSRDATLTDLSGNGNDGTANGGVTSDGAEIVFDDTV